MEDMEKAIKQEKMITKVDALGRIVIPKILRKCLNIKTEERLYVYRKGTKIILEKTNGDAENEENDSLSIWIENDKIILTKK